MRAMSSSGVGLLEGSQRSPLATVIGGAALPLHAFLLGAAASLSLLACQGCPSHAPVVEEPPPQPDGAPTCILSRPAPIADSSGRGPIAVAASHPGGSGFALLYRGNGDSELRYLELDGALAPTSSTEVVGGLSAGPMYPLAVAHSRHGAVVVGLQEGGRRAYTYSRDGDGSFALVEAPVQEALDRRVSAALVTPRAGSGTQVVFHLSGTSALEVGRLAGSLLVRRSIDVPTLLTEPAVASDPLGGLAIATIERRDGDRRVVALREVGSDAVPLRSLVVAEIDPSERPVGLSISPEGGLYWIVWQGWADGRRRVAWASVDEELFELAATGTLGPFLEGEPPTAFVAHPAAGGIVSAWAQPQGDTTMIWAALEALESPAETRVVVQPVDGAAVEVMALVPAGNGRLALFWRQVPQGSTEGPVVAGLLECGR